jgi:hypothetical protein
VADLDAQRRLISQKIADVQGFIESSKFETGADNPKRIDRLLGDAQVVFLILLARARDQGELGPSSPQLEDAARRFEVDVAMSLQAMAEHLRGRASAPSSPPRGFRR